MNLPPAAQALVADPRLARLLQAIHRRLETTGGVLDGTTATLTDPSEDERSAVDRLLGVRSRGRVVRVRLAHLDGLLQDRTGAFLVAVVEEAVGPIRDRPGEREAAASREQAMWSTALDHPAVARHAGLEDWLDRLRATGRWRALDDPPRRITQALDVLDRLPTAVPVGRSRLAASVLGSSHALDANEPDGRLVAGALAHLAGTPGARLTSAARRRLWASAGVDDDETSSTVLTLGLRPNVAGPVTEAACQWANGGVPLPVPLGAVGAEPWAVPTGTLVRVCENPSVVHAAASRFGGDAPPLVSVEGNPSLAALRLLGSLRDGGARLAYHGDFGAGGIGIGNRMIGVLGAEPWRFRCADYLEARARADAAGMRLLPLNGRVPPACWDPDLTAAIVAAAVEVEEELVLDALLADLTG